jgi:hypothetical protein
MVLKLGAWMKTECGEECLFIPEDNNQSTCYVGIGRAESITGNSR